MYFKLVEKTEFDAIEGSQSYASEQIISIVPANSKREAEEIFKKLGDLKIIPVNLNYQEVRESNIDEFSDYLEEL